ANQRRRFGYRRLHILLRREGVMINRKKTQRLYREEGLTVRRRRSRSPPLCVDRFASQPLLSNGHGENMNAHEDVTGHLFEALDLRVPEAAARRRPVQIGSLHFERKLPRW